MQEQTYECESCQHAYTKRYGREVADDTGIRWVCNDCQTADDKDGD